MDWVTLNNYSSYATAASDLTFTKSTWAQESCYETTTAPFYECPKSQLCNIDSCSKEWDQLTLTEQNNYKVLGYNKAAWYAEQQIRKQKLSKAAEETTYQKWLRCAEYIGESVKE